MMKKNKNPKAKRSQKAVPRFRFASISGRLVPLQTVRDRLVGIWETLTWPICVKILKANIAVTIALSFILIDPIRNLTSTSAILASVAVEFVYPNKSYGFIAEDILFGGVMCCISAAWSILGVYLASLVRDPTDTRLAQPKLCAILSCFLVFGCFFLNMFRVNVEQANVGGMLSATIMVLSFTSAVSDTQFEPFSTVN